MNQKPPNQFLDFLVNTNFQGVTQLTNIGPHDVPRTLSFKEAQTCPKYPIWPSRGRLNLMSLRRPKVTFRGPPSLMFKGRPWEVDWILGTPLIFSSNVISRAYRWIAETKIFRLGVSLICFYIKGEMD